MPEEGISYEDFWRHQTGRRRAVQKTIDGVAEKLARLAPSDRVLEIGAGTGHALRHLAEKRPDLRFVGLDNDPKMLTYARRNVGNLAHVELCLADGRERLPFADRSFQAVFSEHTFHHMDDLRRTAAEIARVLVPHGLLVVIDLDRRRPVSRVFGACYPLLRAAGVRRPILEAAYISLRRTRPRDELRQLFADAGFVGSPQPGRRMDLIWTLRKTPRVFSEQSFCPVCPSPATSRPK